MAPAKVKKATAAAKKSNTKRSSRKMTMINNENIDIMITRGKPQNHDRPEVGNTRSERLEPPVVQADVATDGVGDIDVTVNVTGTSAIQDMADLEREMTVVKAPTIAALEKERMQNLQLQRQMETMVDKPSGNATLKSIPRPSGTAGTNFSIQEAMGLAGSTKKYETYKAIQRNLRDLAMNARINWEVPWAQVPARDKAKLFEVARDQHPFLARFERDWATEEIVKQFLKNKRKNHYANGWLEVPEKYTYLKQNAMKRNPTASRSKKALKLASQEVIIRDQDL